MRCPSYKLIERLLQLFSSDESPDSSEDDRSSENSSSAWSPLVSIRQFKLLWKGALPQESALSKVLLTEKDELTAEVFSSV
jgi:hypothetical protein